MIAIPHICFEVMRWENRDARRGDASDVEVTKYEVHENQEEVA